MFSEVQEWNSAESWPMGVITMTNKMLVAEFWHWALTQDVVASQEGKTIQGLQTLYCAALVLAQTKFNPFPNDKFWTLPN